MALTDSEQFQVQLDADNSPVGDTNIVLMNADNKITGVDETDATGKATDLTFRTERVEKLVQRPMTLTAIEQSLWQKSPTQLRR